VNVSPWTRGVVSVNLAWVAPLFRGFFGYEYDRNESVFHVETARSEGRNLAKFPLSGKNCVSFSTTETKHM